MNSSDLLKAMEERRRRLDAALKALKAAKTVRRRGRRKGLRLSAASRMRISASMKQAWAARKGAKNSRSQDSPPQLL